MRRGSVPGAQIRREDSIQAYGLRPRSIGEILDLTFRIYRDGFSTFAVVGIGVALAGFMVSLVWQACVASTLSDVSGDPASLLWSSVPFLLGLPLLIVVFLALHALGCLAVTAAAEDLYLGRSIRALDVLRKSWRRTLPAAATSLLCAILSTVGFLLCCLPGLAVSSIFILAVPLVYLEKRSVSGALERSYALTVRSGAKGLSFESHWMRALAIALVVFAAYYALSLFSQLPILGLSVLPLLGHRTYPTVLGPQPQPLFILLPLQVVCTMIQGVFFAVIFIPWTLLYYDIRTRHEGLDLEQALARLAIADGGEASITGRDPRPDEARPDQERRPGVGPGPGQDSPSGISPFPDQKGRPGEAGPERDEDIS